MDATRKITTREIIKRLIKGEDYRIVTQTVLKKEKKIYKCEVKLMGKGNPESADAFIARESNIFVADKLSDKNKTQFESLGSYWIELRSEKGFLRFEDVLRVFEIPYVLPTLEKIDEKIDIILDEILQ